MVFAQDASTKTLRSGVLEAQVRFSGEHAEQIAFRNLRDGAALSQGELFRIKMQDGADISASTMQLRGAPTITEISADASASRASAHLPGQSMCVDLQHAQRALTVHWCLIARGDQPYLRQELTLHSGSEAIPIVDVEGFHFHDDRAHVVGDVPGSPVVRGNFYLGVEDPLSYSTAEGGEVVAGVRRTLPLGAGQSIQYSSVVGVARPGQLRRDFLAYLEQERAHPYRTFLHYNTWYDLGYGNRFGAEDVLGRMRTFGTELVQKRGVTMDSFLLDDGWDDPHSLWRLNSGFPSGLAALRATAQSYGFGVGVWMSPWGGYEEEKKQRIAYGTAHGYEIVDGGYALSGPRYYARFEETCLQFVTRDGVNQFKFDGTGNANQVFAGSVFDSDFAAAIHLIERLRQANSQLFLNVTTGTRPSPFWLRYADSIWRSGEDHDFAGEGSWRQRWITYRDEQTYANIVRRGPLFPLNSLMLHGIIYAQKADHLADDPGGDFAAEVHSYFGTGTQLQELYLTPSLLSAADWNVLAESARWSRHNAATLRDTHWVGGDPAQNKAYGWASWSKEKGILVLRNPSSRSQEMTLDVRDAFELPEGAAQHYSGHSPWAADAAQAGLDLRAGTPHHFMLKPFEVKTIEALPMP